MNNMLTSRLYKTSILSFYWDDIENSLIGYVLCLVCKYPFSVSLDKNFVRCPECKSVLRINADSIKIPIC